MGHPTFLQCLRESGLEQCDLPTAVHQQQAGIHQVLSQQDPRQRIKTRWQLHSISLLENLGDLDFIEMFCRKDWFFHIQGGGVLFRRFSGKVSGKDFCCFLGGNDNFPLKVDVKTKPSVTYIFNNSLDLDRMRANSCSRWTVWVPSFRENGL